MPTYKKLVNRIAAQTGTPFRPASEQDLDALRSLGLPEPIVHFYAQYEPARCAEGQVRLWPITDILQENRDLLPGAYVAPLGYVVFASTFSGAAYCFDTNVTDPKREPRIVLISHTIVEKGITAARAKLAAKPVAKNLYEFLQQFESVSVDEECVYPPRD